MIYAILVAVLFAGSCMGQFCSIDQKCYIPCPDYTLADAFPFVRQTPVTCEDCMSLCNSLQAGQPPFTCQSAVYDSQYQSCDIFAVSDQSSGGFGFGRRKRAAPHKQKYPGRIFLQPTGMCAGQGGNGTGSTTPAGGSGAPTSGGAATTTAATTTTGGSTSSAAAARKKMLKDQAAIRRRDDIALPNGPCLAHRTANGKRDCSQGIRQMGRSIVKCVPTHNECMNS